MAKKNEIIIKITCIIAAFALWFYISNTENPAMDHVIKNVPVSLVNEERLSESNLALLPEQDLSVSLTVKGTLASVYSSQKDQFNIVADLNYYALKKGENKIPVILKNSPNDIQILNKDNLFITLYLDDVVEKSVPVKVSLSTKIKDGFEEFAPTSKPDSVIVSGAATYVDKVAYVEAQVTLNSYTSDLNKKATLIAKEANGDSISEDYVTIKPSNVDVSVPVNVIKTAKVNIKTTGTLGNNLQLVSITSNPAEVKYAHNVSNSIDITEIDTETIDLSKIKSSNAVLTVKLKSVSNIHLVDSDGTVTITVKADSLLNKKLSIPITVINDSAYNYNLGITSKEITLQGFESIINKINAGNIKLVLDMSKAVGEGEQTLPLSIENLPDGITSSKPDELSILVNLTKK
jgi:YbbR domain-containing protein